MAGNGVRARESRLEWPREQAREWGHGHTWEQPESNICLDFHGDPNKADLVVFSDGNHHMALCETLQRFSQKHPEMGEVFYATTPPNVLLAAIEKSGINLGNLFLSVRPHLFIGPQPALERLVAAKQVQRYTGLAKSQGNVMLVRKGNPKKILGVQDLRRSDVRLFLSNPEREKASHHVYVATLAKSRDPILTAG